MFTSTIKKQTSDCCSISLYPYMVFQTWNHGKKKEKRKAILLLACIADVSQSLLLYANIVFKLQSSVYRTWKISLFTKPE